MGRRIIICDGAETARLWSRIGATEGEELTWVPREEESRARPSGFKALPGTGQFTPTMTAHAAAEAIVDWADENFVVVAGVLEEYSAFRIGYKIAAKKVHPDVNGGDPHRFQVLQECKAILDAHHGEQNG